MKLNSKIVLPSSYTITGLLAYVKLAEKFVKTQDDREKEKNEEKPDMWQPIVAVAATSAALLVGLLTARFSERVPVTEVMAMLANINSLFLHLIGVLDLWSRWNENRYIQKCILDFKEQVMDDLTAERTTAYGHIDTLTDTLVRVSHLAEDRQFRLTAAEEEVQELTKQLETRTEEAHALRVELQNKEVDIQDIRRDSRAAEQRCERRKNRMGRQVVNVSLQPNMRT